MVNGSAGGATADDRVEGCPANPDTRLEAASTLEAGRQAAKTSMLFRSSSGAWSEGRRGAERGCGLRPQATAREFVVGNGGGARHGQGVFAGRLRNASPSQGGMAGQRGEMERGERRGEAESGMIGRFLLGRGPTLEP